MQSQYNYVYGYEIAKSHQAEIQAEVRRCRAHAEADAEAGANTVAQERRRFFRMYQVRSLLFRLAPNWAARLER